MPLKPTPGLIVVGIVIFVLIIVGIAALASSGGVKPKQIEGLRTCTVNAELGIAAVNITNTNTGKSIIKTAADLPYTFNFTAGDTLKFNVTTLPNYQWNAWEISAPPWFAQDNPYYLKIETNVQLNGKILIIG